MDILHWKWYSDCVLWKWYSDGVLWMFYTGNGIVIVYCGYLVEFCVFEILFFIGNFT